MIFFRPVLYVFGIVLVSLAAVMLLPMMLDLYLNDGNWKSFAIGATVASFFGSVLILINYSEKFDLSVRQIFLLTVTCWFGVGFFSAIPLLFADIPVSFTDAVFESVSGITTTGASVINNLDRAPKGILLWRAALQGIGGVGFIVAAILFLPFMRVGGMQLYRTEASESDKFMPRTVQVARNIAGVYCTLVFICAIAYKIAGMSIFDAVCHAMPTIATGGFSTHDASMAYFNSFEIEVVGMVFMILGALPFVLLLKASGGNIKALANDEQVRGFIKLLLFAIAAVSVYVSVVYGRPYFQVFREVAFNTVSIATTTGFTSVNYNHWGTFGITVLFYLMFTGGCSGSTAAGLKIFRIQILKNIVGINMRKMIYPHASVQQVYNGKTVSWDVKESVKTFFFIYVGTFAVLTIIAGMSGITFDTAFAAIAQGMANVGAGFGEKVGPHTNFANIPDAAKWTITASMLLGRLEILNIVVLFTPMFWKQ